MISLEKAISIKKLDFELTKGGDIYYFEGPYLSHFTDERGIDYLMNWVDLDGQVNRWLLFRVSGKLLNGYFSRKVSLFELVTSTETGAVFFIDLDSDLAYKNIYILNVHDTPEEYLPKKDSFFDPIHAEKYSLSLAGSNKKRLTLSENSIVEKVVKELFIEHVNFNSFIRFNSIKVSCFNNPSNIDEIAISQTLAIPLMLHYHSSNDERIKNLLQISPSIICRRDSFNSYLGDVYKTIVNPKLPKEFEVESILKGVLQSTHDLVKDKPDIYGSIYNDWLLTIKAEYSNINGIGHLVKARRRLTLATLTKATKKK